MSEFPDDATHEPEHDAAVLRAILMWFEYQYLLHTGQTTLSKEDWFESRIQEED